LTSRNECNKLAEIDLANGKIAIKHDPTSAVGWPATEMGFKAIRHCPNACGDQVDFTLTLNGKDAKVTTVPVKSIRRSYRFRSRSGVDGAGGGGSGFVRVIF
jgi:Cu/Ag efflux protein CusF